MRHGLRLRTHVVKNYLNTMDLLRFITCGNVDDGKSTLTGRLLYDSRAVSPDLLETIERQSRNKTANGTIDLALLTDGLRAEREQGITIDVAYKYFSTSKRKFILADAPGHVQYTRNMVTGASTADAAIILLDARKGVTEQTRRHSAIAALLGIPHSIVCINKIDLVDYSEAVFADLVASYLEFSGKLELNTPQFIPVSALAGDNVVHHSEKMPWYNGPTLLDYLETVEPAAQHRPGDSRFQVQLVIRPGESSTLHDYRGYAGQIQSGVYRKGDRVVVFPSGIETTIKSIEVHQQEVDEAFAPQPAVLQLTDEIDISRGASIVQASKLPEVKQHLGAMLCITGETPLRSGDRFLLQHGSNRVKAILKSIDHKLDMGSLKQIGGPAQLQVNDLAQVQLQTSKPVAFDPYRENRKTGAFILIHEHSNQTVAAGMFQ